MSATYTSTFDRSLTLHTLHKISCNQHIGSLHSLAAKLLNGNQVCMHFKDLWYSAPIALTKYRSNLLLDLYSVATEIADDVWYM